MIPPTRKAVEKYREVSEKLANPALLSELRSLFERRYTLVELLEWLHKTVEWSKGNIVRHNDPMEIIAYGKGRCGEFSILFTALCLAHNYRARLILDMSDHIQTEVWDNEQKRWIHVDPSEKKIDDPLMYERDWKKNLREIYAFENGNVENVTKRYKMTENQGLVLHSPQLARRMREAISVENKHRTSAAIKVFNKHIQISRRYFQ